MSFGYDPLDRLTSATYSDGQGLTYGYDAAGNRLSENWLQGNTVQSTNSYSYAAQSNRLQTVNSLSQTYDANGNMIERNVTGTVWTQTFDGENRLVAVSNQQSAFSFAYDGDGNRVKQVYPDGTFTIYIAGLYEATYSSTGTLLDTKLYYAFAGKVVAMRDNSVLYYLHTDHLGSTRVVTGSTGQAVSLNAYYPFGASKYTGGARPTDMDFTGQRLDATGLNFYNARYYDSAIGRFVSADSIVPQPGGSQGFNRYAYAMGNPVRYMDPTGHAACYNTGVEIGSDISQADCWAYGAWISGGAAIDQTNQDILTIFFPSADTTFEDRLAASARIGALSVGVAAITIAAVAYTAPAVGAAVNDLGWKAVALCARSVICWSAIGASGAPSTGQGGAWPVRVGQAGEEAAGITGPKVRIPIPGTDRIRIPDELTETTLREVKNIQYLSLTTQLSDFLNYAQATGREFILDVRQGTRISGPLQGLIDSGLITLRRILP